MKPFETGLNAKQSCRCGLTNSKYYDTNISEVRILVLAQDNVVVFSAALSHFRNVNFWSASIPNLFHMNHFKPVFLALYFCILNSNLPCRMYSCCLFQDFLTFQKIISMPVFLIPDLNSI